MTSIIDRKMLNTAEATRSLERVVLCGLLSDISVSLMSGGQSRSSLLTVCFLLDLETAAVWTALSDSLVVSASNGAIVV